MGHIHQEVRVDAPIEHVFELALAVERQREWNPYMEMTNVTGPIDKIGTTFDTTFHLLGRTLKSTGKIIEAEPLKLLRLRGTGEAGTADWLYRFERMGDKTLCTLDIDYESSGTLAGVFDKLIYHGALERATRHMAENFQALAEEKVPQPV